ncbi:hypothetical protein ACSQ67_024016 [Phaseolus vulgaris]
MCNSKCNINFGVNLSSLGNAISNFDNATVYSKKLKESNKVSGARSGGCARKNIGLNDALITRVKEWSDDLIWAFVEVRFQRWSSLCGLECGGGWQPFVHAVVGNKSHYRRRSRRLGWNGDVRDCEGARLVNGREDEAGSQLSSAMADGRRSLSGSENKILNPTSPNNGATRQVDGSFVCCELNRVPLVSFGRTGSQPRALLNVNASHESFVSLDCSD